ncbi:MAG: hypothetical protein NTY37_00715 [Methanothrix sp.]|nr:hypothetical protein [Methanothrix sp.]
MKRPMIIPMLLIIIFTICLSPGHSVNDSSNETALQATAAVAAPNESEPGSVPRLSYIWSVTGIESGQVIMVLNQDGSDLYGRAKYEPDSGQAWNAVVIGLVEEGRVSMVLTALKDTGQFSSRLKGTYDSASESIKGDLLQTSNGNISLRSDFEAMWINPDISSYTAARAEPRAAASTPGQEINATLPGAKDNLLPASSQKSRYHDVHQDADRILTGVGDISQIPIGMSGL